MRAANSSKSTVSPRANCSRDCSMARRSASVSVYSSSIARSNAFATTASAEGNSPALTLSSTYFASAGWVTSTCITLIISRLSDFHADVFLQRHAALFQVLGDRALELLRVEEVLIQQRLLLEEGVEL